MSESDSKSRDGKITPPKSKPFRKTYTAVRLSSESVERQSRVTLLAWDLLGGDAARAFLNGHNEALAGRPLDLAVASEAGYDAVVSLLSARR